MFDCTSFINRMGWKQKDLAQRVGVGTSAVGMWCTGKSFPTYESIQKLIDLGITADELLGRSLFEKLLKNSGYEQPEEFDKSILDTPEFKARVTMIFKELDDEGKKI